MSNPVPTSVALTVINTNDPIDSAPLRNDFAALQAAVNGLIATLSNGTAGQVLSAVDATNVVYGLLVNANIDPAAAIALTKLAAGTNHALLLSGASTVGSLPTGTAGQLLASGGAGADPSWVAPPTAAPAQTPVALHTLTTFAGTDGFTPDASLGEWQIWNINNQHGAPTTVSIAPPDNPPDSTHTQELTIALKTNASSADTINLTWNAVYKTDGFTLPAVMPATGFSCYGRFRWDGAAWICIGVTSSGYGGGNG